jgi:hypothetical protein
MEIPINAQVTCTDGVYGRSEYVLIDPVIDQVTHLVVKATCGAKKDVMIPLSAMGETREDTMFLKINKHQIESLPTFPVNRHWA